MQRHDCHILKPHSPANAELIRDLQKAMRDLDPGLVETLPPGLANVAGDRMLLKTACDAEFKLLALEVLDTHAQHLWELSLVQLPNSTRIASRRSIWKQPDVAKTDAGTDPADVIWGRVLAPHLLEEPFEPRHQPHFLALAGACVSTCGLVTKDDGAVIKALQDDVEYWKGLAKAQTKLLKRVPTETTAVPAPQATAGQDAEAPSTTREWSLKEMDQWAALNSDRITILPRAISEAKRSNYHDPDLVYACLELLANEYSTLKRGESSDRNIFKDRADRLGLSYGGSVEPSVAGERGDQYFIRWRGQRRFLDQHLTKGNARDPRYCLRIYYTWDEVDGKVVVGWLPSHLGTSST